jgi:PAS domain S-box-containing protein
MTADYFGPVEEVTGLAPEDLTDPRDVITQVIHPEDQDTAQGAFEDLLTTEEETIDIEFRTNPENGPVSWVRTQAFVERETSDDTLVGFSTEITPLKKKEARLDEFIGIVAHDLRNPLSVAMGRVALAREDGNEEDFEAVTNALDRMEVLIDDMLTLARAGQTVAEKEPVEIPSLVEDCWATVETKSATLEITTEKTVLADRSRLRQLFENLFRNAVEHGGEDVTVEVGDLPNGFFVEDDGSGLSEQVRDQIFQPNTDGVSEDMGLGLRIVNQVVEAHGWDVRALESATGGARFEVSRLQSV